MTDCKHTSWIMFNAFAADACKHPSWIMQDGEMTCSQCGTVWTDETMGPEAPHPAIEAIHASWQRRAHEWPSF